MNITVKILGIPLNIQDGEVKTVALPEGATIKSLMICLTAGTDISGREMLKATSFLVNNQKATPDTVLQDQDQVLILRMLGGG